MPFTYRVIVTKLEVDTDIDQLVKGDRIVQVVSVDKIKPRSHLESFTKEDSYYKLLLERETSNYYYPDPQAQNLMMLEINREIFGESVAPNLTPSKEKGGGKE